MRKPILRPRAIVRDGAVHLTWMKSTPLFTAGDRDEFASFRLLRREEDFVFGEDYEEYFLGLTAAGAEPVFEGPLPAAGERRYRVTDPTARIGRTYSYWIQTASSPPIGPIPVRVRDPEVWWPAARLDAELQALAKDHPGRVQLTTCGHTAGGAPIPAVAVGRGPRALGLVGLIHAGEAGPELILPVLRRLLSEAPDLFEDVRLVAVPAVNRDERQRLAEGVPWYLRTNAQAVDLNRNFPAQWDQVEYGYGLDSSDPASATYRGPGPASAPETRAVMAALDLHPVDALLSYHCLASICSLPALAACAARECAPYAARCARLVEALASGLHPQRPETSEALSFGCSAGSLPAWLFERGVPALDLEGGADPDALAQCRVDGTDRQLLEEYRDRHCAGLVAVLRALAAARL